MELACEAGRDIGRGQVELDRAHPGHVVTRQRADVGAERGALQSVEQSADGWMLEVGSRDHEVEAHLGEGHEFEAEHEGGGTKGESGVRASGGNSAGRRHVASRETVVPRDPLGRDPLLCQHLVEERSTSGALFAVHDAHVRTGEVRDAANSFRVARLDDESQLPSSELDHEAARWSQGSARVEKVIGRTIGIAKVRAGNVRLAPGDRVERVLARC
ncbi:MAG: hypothetical protein HW416_858 [Chloroflexi bacterium]|nr:hypothetical protein [Chloroflexota bacterium]